MLDARLSEVQNKRIARLIEIGKKLEIDLVLSEDAKTLDLISRATGRCLISTPVETYNETSG